jgi:8-oxo-dGTP pyrophosphatase MutT (NUDIX family)
MNRLKTTSVIYRREDGFFLGVSRKYDYTSFGFAGGKCEEGESTIQCAVREFKEETGLEITSMNLKDVRDYDNKTVNPTSHDEVWCYVVRSFKGDFLNTEELIAKGEGITAWVLPDDLIAGAFGDYNKEILEKIYGITS